MTQRWLRVVVIAAMAVLTLAALGCSSDELGEPAATATAAQHEDGDDELTSAAVDQSVNVVMRDFEFAPAAIAVNAGAVIELSFQNEGSVAHDFTIDDGDLDMMMMGDMESVAGHDEAGHMEGAAMHVPLDAGHDAMTRLRMHEPGEYTYYCTVAGHRELGMEGTITVR